MFRPSASTARTRRNGKTSPPLSTIMKMLQTNLCSETQKQSWLRSARRVAGEQDRRLAGARGDEGDLGSARRKADVLDRGPLAEGGERVGGSRRSRQHDDRRQRDANPSYHEIPQILSSPDRQA